MFQVVEDAIPHDLSGRRVLDIGGYSGEYSQLALSRGAESVTLVDSEEWRQYGWTEPALEERIRFVKADFMDYTEPADVVFFGNVWYHLKDPFAGIRHVYELTIDQAIIWTRFENNGADERGWHWWHDGAGHPNGTVYCTPTEAAAIAAVKDAGFTTVVDCGRQTDHLVLSARR